MSSKILYVTATAAEAESLNRIKGIIPVPAGYRFENLEIMVLITGVGAAATAWELKNWLSVNEIPDLIINGGIAGSYNDDIRIGDVVMPVSDCFADSGIEDGDDFLTLFESGLAGPDELPFSNGILLCKNIFVERVKSICKPVRALTVNKATGSELTRNILFRKYNPDIETMEGATFFYICIREKIPFLALRAISNKVERRNRGAWNISVALDNLSETLRKVIQTLY